MSSASVNKAKIDTDIDKDKPKWLPEDSRIRVIVMVYYLIENHISSIIDLMWPEQVLGVFKQTSIENYV